MSNNYSNEFGEKPEEGKEHKAMSLFEHLDELRGRLVKSALAIVAFFCIAMFYSEPILLFLREPLDAALPAGANTLHFTGPMDVFLVSIKVAFLTALVFACPVWIYQFWRFVEPALYEHEKKWILPFTFVSIALFIAGISLCYFFVFPLSLEFLLGLGTNIATSIITITDYTSMLILMVLAFGAVFQTPLILVMCALLDLIDAKTLTEYRGAIIVGIFATAAIITPPDPVSQMGVALPMIMMFEGSVLVIKLIKREPKKETVVEKK